MNEHWSKHYMDTSLPVLAMWFALSISSNDKISYYWDFILFIPQKTAFDINASRAKHSTNASLYLDVKTGVGSA